MSTHAGFLNRGAEDKKQHKTNKPTRDEEEEELFEINLEAVDCTTSFPPYEWERFSKKTGSVLLANCLLPAADISGAVPTKTGTWSELVWVRGFLYIESLEIGNKKA